MPYIETVVDLTEDIADWAGIYGGHDEACNARERIQDKCRICFTDELAQRIRRAVSNEVSLQACPR